MTRDDSAMSLATNGVGINISPEDTLGLKTEQTVFRLDGHYRLNSQDAVTFSWYNINTESSKILTHDIEWADENNNKITIPIGVRTTSRFNYDVYRIGYLWSFYNTDKVELSAEAGLQITHIEVNLKSDTTSSGADAGDIKSTVPLPLLAFGLNYNVSPKLFWYLN